MTKPDCLLGRCLLGWAGGGETGGVGRCCCCRAVTGVKGRGIVAEETERATLGDDDADGGIRRAVITGDVRCMMKEAVQGYVSK